MNSEYWLKKLQDEKAKREKIEYEIDSLNRRKKVINKNIVKYHEQYLKLVTNDPIKEVGDD